MVCILICAVVLPAVSVDRENVYIVILAGGKGERLWPLSREHTPKQFLAFTNQKSLLEHTIERIEPIVDKERLGIISIDQQKQLLCESVGDKIGILFTEPSSRNTGPAILYACMEIARENPHAVIAFLPADHYIPDQGLFRKNLLQAIEYSAENGIITLLGIKPLWPATGYGYIEFMPISDADIKPVITFHEKPSRLLAQQYIQKSTMLWNAGMFCAPVSTFLDDFKEHASKLYTMMLEFIHHRCSYSEIENISIDLALIEKTNTAVLPVAFSWSDVGNLDTFLSLMQESYYTHQNVIEVESENNVVMTKKLTTIIGLSDICVVETDDVLLISHRKDVEKVKLVLQQLKQNNLTAYL